MFGNLQNRRSRVFLSGLSERANKAEIVRIFSRYGPAKQLWISVRPPWIALVHFEDENDAREAFRRFNGMMMKKKRVKIDLFPLFPKELSKTQGYLKNHWKGTIRKVILQSSESFGHDRQIWAARQQSSIALIYCEQSSDAIRTIRLFNERLMLCPPVTLQLTKEMSLLEGESAKVCVSDLGEETDEMEIEESFMAFGRLKFLWFSRPLKIANVFFENDKDASEAVRCLDGTLMSGRRVSVDLDREMPVSRCMFYRKRNIYPRVRVSGLCEGMGKNKIEKAFKYFGRVPHVWVARQPPWIAYVFFDDHGDAQEASRCLDGSFLDGKQIKVTLVKLEKKSNPIKRLKVYVSGLGEGTDEYDVEKVFGNFGLVKQVWVARQQPGTATVYFDDAREALKAINHLDGTHLNGNQIKVQIVMETLAKSKWESTKVHVEGLGEGADKRELTKTFMAHGCIKHVWASRKPFGTLCVFFEKFEDAEKARSHLHKTYMNGVQIRVTIPMGKQNRLRLKAKSATETKMDLNEKDCKNLPSSSERWADIPAKGIQNGDSQEHSSLFEEISRFKHLVNSEERPIDENLQRVASRKRYKLPPNWKCYKRHKASTNRKGNKKYKAGLNMKVNIKNNNSEGANRKRPLFVNILKKEISSIVENSRNEKKRISNRNVCTEKRNFARSSETSSTPMMDTMVTMTPPAVPSLSAPLIQLSSMIIDQSSAQTALSGSTSIIYIVNNYHHHHHYSLHPQLQYPVDEGSLCFMDVKESSMKSNAVQDNTCSSRL